MRTTIKFLRIPTKKLSVFILLIFIYSICNSQSDNVEAVNNTLKNTITYQMFNDFKTTVPLFFMVPGFMFAGSVDITHIPVFVETDYYNNVELLKRKDYLHKEFFDVIDVSFMPYIPSDSVMQVKVIDKNLLLYTMRFEQNGDTLVYTQTSADTKEEKTLWFINGYPENTIFTYKHGMSWVRTERSGDTLIKKTEFDASKGENLKNLIHLQEGKPFLIESYKKAPHMPDFRLQATENYQYEDGRLSAINTFNRRGRMRSSIKLLYVDKNLYHFEKSKRNDVSISVRYRYDDLGRLERKEVKTNRRNFSVKYDYKDKMVNQLVIQEEGERYHHRLVFEKDVNDQLVMISIRRVFNDNRNPGTYARYVFGYLNNGNIESLKVINPKGHIIKDIRFEYSFFQK